MKASFTKPYSSPEQIVQVLKSRGMLMKDEHKVENYLMNIGYHRLSAYIYPFYKYFQFSILMLLPKTVTADEAVRKEQLFKRKLGTNSFGLNNN